MGESGRRKRAWEREVEGWSARGMERAKRKQTVTHPTPFFISVPALLNSEALPLLASEDAHLGCEESECTLCGRIASDLRFPWPESALRLACSNVCACACSGGAPPCGQARAAGCDIHPPTLDALLVERLAQAWQRLHPGLRTKDERAQLASQLLGEARRVTIAIESRSERRQETWRWCSC
eukprot:3002069-Pleurochrysis_carterae.AAC.1